MKKIIYKDKLRDVVVIAKPSDKYFMFDLSEYTDDEKAYYEMEIERINQMKIDMIKDLGLSSNYRYFNEDNIEWIEDET